MTWLRRLLLVVCAVGFAAGLWLVVGALLPVSAPAAPSASPAEVIKVPAGSASVHGFGASARPFEIDALEVSVAEYQACVRAAACPLHVTAANADSTLEVTRGLSTGCVGGGTTAPDEPINCVDYAAAEAFCKWAGKRLPTREEWWVAFAVRHREAFQELHRKRARRGTFWAEWTSTPVTIEGRSTVEALRHTIAYQSSAANEDRLGQLYIRTAAVADRSSDLGFRCAR